MSNGKSVGTVVVIGFLLMSTVLVFISQNASASFWRETTDTDFADGDFAPGAYETVVHETGAAAYVQNKMNMTTWVNKHPATDPGLRRSFGFSNDSAESRMILFGGSDGSNKARNDTWEYNISANNWVLICNDDTPACAPPRRWGLAMAYDNNSKVAVLFGGYDKNMKLLNDTWEYNVLTNTWTNRTGTPRPTTTGNMGMTYDPVGKQMILVTWGASSFEVWAYDASAHTWASKLKTGGPTQRFSFSLAYNYQTNHKRVVFFGGEINNVYYNDLWEYNPQTNSWASITISGDIPDARSYAAMTYAYKPDREGLYLWGGRNAQTETWRYYYEGSTPTWASVTVVSSPSPARERHGLAYDRGRDALILFAGLSGTVKLNDTWSMEVAFNLEGHYISNVFNTYTPATQWQKIFWNQTPVTVPPNTLIRMQVNLSNECTVESMTQFYGPYKDPFNFYVTPGESFNLLGDENGKFRCIRYNADLITYDPSIAPRLEDVTIFYVGVDMPPKVLSVSPNHGEFGVQFDVPVIITFSRPMNTNNVWVSTIPNVTFSKSWGDSDSKLTMTHSQPFLEAKKYDLCVWGTDTLGRILNHTGGKFCWWFLTMQVAPYITNTTPWLNQQDVLINAQVTITFSEPMDTRTCWPDTTIEPDVSGKAWGWRNSDTVLVMYHNGSQNNFQQLTEYRVVVPMGDPSKPCKDKAGILLTVSSIPENWTFKTEALNPYIVSTTPMDLETNVAVTKVIEVKFSRDMQQSSMTYAFKDGKAPSYFVNNWTGPLTAVWVNARTLQFTHTTNFPYCNPFQMQIWALDTTGKALIKNTNAPNPWRFMTTGSSGQCAPYMFVTMPADGEKEVPLTQDIRIMWHYDPDFMSGGGMNNASFTFSLKDPLGYEISGKFDRVWEGPGSDIVNIVHKPGHTFLCGEHTLRVLTARDRQGRAFIDGLVVNPFRFWTNATICPPVIVWTIPVNGTLTVPLDQDIIIKFNKPINPSLFDFTLRPIKLPYNFSWNGPTNVTVTHAPLTECEWYNATAIAVDTEGNPLMPGPVPNPWTFRAFCPGQGPYISSTYPKNSQVDIPWTAPIYINFSQPMDTNSLVFTFNDTSIVFSSPQWTNNDKTAILYHNSTQYFDCRWYKAQVVSARNKTGVSLIGGGAPNPWNFRALCLSPKIMSTIPANGTTDVSLGDPLTALFNEPIVPGTFQFKLEPTIGWSVTWPNQYTAQISHSTFLHCTWYKATVVYAADRDGNNIVPGPVPNPWVFKTDCRFPLKGLQVHRTLPYDVTLTWTASVEANYYKVFHSNNRLIPLPLWAEIANVTTTSVLIPDHIRDLQNHFYIVKGYGPTGESTNSTMGAIWHAVITLNVGKPNTFWFSLPYNTIYKRASDIANELGSSKINVVAKWDPARQQSIVYSYMRGRWQGTNFPINAGDGLWLGIVSSFDWAVNGTDKSISLTFTLRPLQKNYYWISLPYTGRLGKATDLVISIEGGLGPNMNKKIDMVGKWNFRNQASDIFSYGLTGWGGTDFDINPGDGIWLRITSSFSWIPPLITPEVP